MLTTTDDLRAWLRWPADDFDVDAAVLVLEAAETLVRSVSNVGKALDHLDAEAASPEDTDLWRTAKMVALEHAAGVYGNPDGAMQRRIDQAGSVSFGDSRHSVRDLTRGQRERLKASLRSSGLHSVALS